MYMLMEDLEYFVCLIYVYVYICLICVFVCMYLE